jgi:hypothetical protein
MGKQRLISGRFEHGNVNNYKPSAGIKPVSIVFLTQCHFYLKNLWLDSCNQISADLNIKT